MKRQWQEIPLGDKRAQWAGMYVTMNSKGVIAMNRATHSANNTIGPKPTAISMRNASPAQRSGRHGGPKVNAYRLLTERSLVLKQTLEFPAAEIDDDGILILNFANGAGLESCLESS